MATRDRFHSKPFDDGTLTKLTLFRQYLEEWLPVFISRYTAGTRIYIVDLFSGPGKDSNGKPGSPLIALKVVRKYSNLITRNRVIIRLIFNDRSSKKAEALQSLMVSQNIPSNLCKWAVSNLEADEAFVASQDELADNPTLLFLDQFGMTYISDEMFLKLIELRRTDLLFFISSSQLRRFEEHPSIHKYLDIPSGSLSSAAFEDTHRAVQNYYRSLIPLEAEYYIGAFSIKKGSNLYGLIFGSHHPLGLEKFLRVCWRVDPITGEANFDIDREQINPEAPRLFPDMDRPHKLDAFRLRLRDDVLSGKLATDREVYLASLQDGVLPAEARSVLAELKKSRLISSSQPKLRFRVSKDGYNEPRKIKVIYNGQE